MSWDKYAPFYDWENARTMGRRDLPFWKKFVAPARGAVLELGCGTGRVLAPLARTGAAVVGIDRSSAMLARARRRVARLSARSRPRLVLGDICSLPFHDASLAQVIAPYGVLQSLMTDDAFDAAVSESARVLRRGGRFGMELIPDLRDWKSYQRQVRFRGKLGRAQVTLVESVRQNRRRGVTIFDEEFTTREGRRTKRHRFSLTFRTLSMDVLLGRLSQAGFSIDSVLGDYRGGVWTPDSDVWIIEARR